MGKTLTVILVRRHHICRTRGRAGSDQGKLLQLVRHDRQDRIPTPIYDDEFACQPQLQTQSLGIASCTTRARGCELGNMVIKSNANATRSIRFFLSCDIYFHFCSQRLCLAGVWRVISNGFNHSSLFLPLSLSS